MTAPDFQAGDLARIGGDRHHLGHAARIVAQTACLGRPILAVDGTVHAVVGGVGVGDAGVIARRGGVPGLDRVGEGGQLAELGIIVVAQEIRVTSARIKFIKSCGSRLSTIWMLGWQGSSGLIRAPTFSADRPHSLDHEKRERPFHESDHAGADWLIPPATRGRWASAR